MLPEQTGLISPFRWHLDTCQMIPWHLHLRAPKIKAIKPFQFSYLPFSSRVPENKNNNVKTGRFVQIHDILRPLYFIDMRKFQLSNPAVLRVVIYSVFLSLASFARQV